MMSRERIRSVWREDLGGGTKRMREFSLSNLMELGVGRIN